MLSKKIAIIGLGGTGSYVLDLVAKTPVKEIHLFDGDTFLQHNAFRSPGAPSGEELRAKLPKVTYLKNAYGKMHTGIVAHPVYRGCRRTSKSCAAWTSYSFAVDKGQRQES